MNAPKVLALTAILSFASNAHAATYGSTKAIPMPFQGGATVMIQSDVTGPFQNARAYISVTLAGGTNLIPPGYQPPIGAVANGASKTIKFSFKAPLHEPGKNISVFVVFVEANEQYVGEPGPSRSLILVPRCKGTGKSTTCTYATARYWIETTRVGSP